MDTGPLRAGACFSQLLEGDKGQGREKEDAKMGAEEAGQSRVRKELVDPIVELVGTLGPGRAWCLQAGGVAMNVGETKRTRRWEGAGGSAWVKSSRPQRKKE